MSRETEKTNFSILLHHLGHGGLVCDAELACSIGELLVERHYGAEDLPRQRPLGATDKGDYWRVEGAWNRDEELEGSGPFFMSITKFDGRITDFGRLAVIHPHPDALARIKAGPPKSE